MKFLGKSVGKRNTTSLNAYESDISFGMPFGNFMGDAPYSPAYGFPIH
jgi:hypothetical protein